MGSRLKHAGTTAENCCLAIKTGWSLKAATWRAARGGSWINTGNNLRAALRNNNQPDNRNNNRGFRVVVSSESRSACLIFGTPMPPVYGLADGAGT